ncbi:MAG: SWIM zinc finger family protein [bacterium]|nr:SWIM zinc finger family protein [bacterium]
MAGTSDYQVTIQVDKEDIEASCTCPYDWGGYCKHVVATFIALSEDYHRIKKRGEEEEQKIGAILSSLSLDELKGFLMTEFEEDPALREHFTIYFSGKSSKRRSIHDYKKEINLLYREAGGRYGYIEYGDEVDFSYIRNLATRYIKAGNFLEATTVYQALSEVIAENMDDVDDSNGYYGDEFIQTIEDFADCINKAKLNHQEKRSFISYLFDKYIKEEWRNILSFIINNLSKSKFGAEGTTISIYLREGMFDQALEHVLARRDLYTLSSYHKDLSIRYPERYFNAYRELIIPFAESKMGRPHYQEIVRYLNRMKQIPGFGNEFRKVVTLLKERYSNRPAFFDEVRKV